MTVLPPDALALFAALCAGDNSALLPLADLLEEGSPVTLNEGLTRIFGYRVVEIRSPVYIGAVHLAPDGPTMREVLADTWRPWNLSAAKGSLGCRLLWRYLALTAPSS